MLSKAKASFVISLQRKKIRDQEGVYVIEGDKLVKDYLLAGMPVVSLIAKKEWIAAQGSKITSGVNEVIPVTLEELRKISSLKAPHNALAVVKKEHSPGEYWPLNDHYSLILETIQDPGNLGTIVRAASWFGIKTVICSPDSVSCHNTKVVQASMGGLINVRVLYTDLEEYLRVATEANIPVFGTYPQGSPLYRTAPPKSALLLFGNESKGIGSNLERYVTEKISIARGGGSREVVDSLNVAMSAAIVMSHFSCERLQKGV